MADIFISYAREDRLQAERLARALQGEGFDVWWDIDSLGSGRSFSKSIQEALEKVERVLVLWSANSVSSGWVEAEALWAWNHDKLHSIWLADDVPVRVPFNASHARNLAAWDGSSDFPELQRLIADIGTLIGTREATEPVSEAERPSTSAANGDQGEHPLPELEGEPGRQKQEGLKESEAKRQEARGPKPGQANDAETGSRTWSRVVQWAETLASVWAGFLVLGVAISGVLWFMSPVILSWLEDETPAMQPTASHTDVSAEAQDDTSISNQTVPKNHSSKDGAEGLEMVVIPDGESKSDEEPTTSAVQGQSELKPLDVFRDTLEDGSEGPEMVVIPAGQFQMGCVSGKGCQDDELPVRTVSFDRPFAIGKYEVTFAEYDRFAEATGAEKPKDKGRGRGRRPAIYVTWDAAVAYAEWLSQQTGKPYRLPSEAEWEYAARADTDTAWSFGNNQGDLTQHAWYTANSWGKSHPVGQKEPNPWGLKDVHGNVWEWVQDCWNKSYQGAPSEGSAWESSSCDLRVVRGGAWNLEPEFLRAASRYWFLAFNRNLNLGFRLAQDL